MIIDLNADLGEECGDDAAIFPYLTSANIACGAHAGGVRSMDIALADASRHGVTVGAHVGYEDRANFGRIAVDATRAELTESIRVQIERLMSRAARFNVRVRYVKPHGALYHRVASDAMQACALVDAVRACDPTLELLVPFSPLLLETAGPLRCRHEFFADRGYHLNGQLVPRSDARAHVETSQQVVNRTLEWLRTGEVLSVEGKSMRIFADSICLHGDSQNSVETARTLHASLVAHDVRIASWFAA